ncbi:hypothetical protein [Streptomyces sp. NPDC058985]|uniref:hypothetical protein n=1 Tax=Streptomyces sp. NPDC058985 TaxID=3346684 RepID=UPI0036B6984E
MDQHTGERHTARCYALWAAATNFRRHNTPEVDKTSRRTRIKTNAIKTLANITYYGGTLGAGVGLYELLGQPTALGIVVVLVFTLTVEGILSTLIGEAATALLPAEQDTAAVKVSPAKEAIR